MSAIETNQPLSPISSQRSSKKSTRVDLTPMVDLGFLLITFFVFTTRLSTPTVMKVNMPYDKVLPADEVCASCQLTLFLDKDNSIQYFEGMPENNPVLHRTGFNQEGIRAVIRRKQQQLRELPGRKDALVLIIKPSAGSNFQNFVDMVDEVAINNVKHYYIDAINHSDSLLLAKK